MRCWRSGTARHPVQVGDVVEDSRPVRCGGQMVLRPGSRAGLWLLRGSAKMSMPSISAVPDVGVTRPHNMRRVVACRLRWPRGTDDLAVTDLESSRRRRVEHTDRLTRSLASIAT